MTDKRKSPGILLEQDTGTSKDTIAVEEAAQSHSKVETLLSQMRMRALLNAQFSLMEELKGARTADHKELGAAYQKLEDAFQSVLIAEGEIQRGKAKLERESRMETQKMEGPEPIKLIIHAECEMGEVKELMKIMTEIQKEYSCNCTLDVKKYVVFH